MGKITVNIGSLCLKNPRSIIHELQLVLGLWHEHVRPDRDTFIEILRENIRSDSKRSFEIQPMTMVA